MNGWMDGVGFLKRCRIVPVQKEEKEKGKKKKKKAIKASKILVHAPNFRSPWLVRIRIYSFFSSFSTDFF